MNLVPIWTLAKESISNWFNDGAPRLAAALAYYTIFSVAPLLIIAIAIAGVVYGEAAVQGQVVGEIKGIMGEEAAVVIQNMLESARKSPQTRTAAIISIVLLLFGATVLVGQLKESLNIVLEVPRKSGSGVVKILRDRFLALLMILGIGFFLLALLVVSTVISTLKKHAETWGVAPSVTWQVLDIVLSLAVMTLVFAMLYRYLPDVRIAWSDVWMGAAVTALLFNAGKYAIGSYLSHAAPASSYGAAGSVVVILLWVYYSSLILLLGAEFTQVYSTRYGSRIRYARAQPQARADRQKAAEEGPASAREDKGVMEKFQSEVQFLENETYRAKEALKRTLRDLTSTAKEAANPKKWPAQYRWGALGTVTLLGTAIGTTIFKKSRRSARRPERTFGRRTRERARAEDDGKSAGQTLLASILGMAGGALATALQSAVKGAVSSAISAKTQYDTSEQSSSGSSMPR